jgi:hypothetical protein
MSLFTYIFDTLTSVASFGLSSINVFCIKSEGLVRKLVGSCEEMLMKIAIILQHQTNR